MPQESASKACIRSLRCASPKSAVAAPRNLLSQVLTETYVAIVRGVFVVLVLGIAASCARADVSVQSGDLVFQRSSSSQSAIIADVTGSEWTHVGVVFVREGEPWVLEAVQPVRWTRYSEWSARGGGRVLVRRPREPLGEAQIDALRREGERHLSRPYDVRFEWSDHRMYCSELVWKMYERALGIRLSEPERWSELVLSPAARALARRRLGRLPPARGLVVTPAALAGSPRLFTPE